MGKFMTAENNTTENKENEAAQARTEQAEGEPGGKKKKAKAKKMKSPLIKKPSFFSAFSLKQMDELVGVDIGTTSIKVCSLKTIKNVLTVQNIIKKTYEQDLLSDGHIVDLDFVAQELRQIFSDNKIKSKNVACAMSSYSVITKKVSTPFIEESALEKMVDAEVENVIPFPIKDIYYSHYVMGVDPEKENMMNVQIVAAKKEIVDGYIEAFNMAGLRLQILDVDIFTVTNTIEKLYGPRDFSVVAVDIGASVTNIAILKGENIEFTREILMGGKYLTGQIEKTTKLPYEEAEKKKIAGDSDILYLFEDFIFNISSEINKTVKFYLATKPKETIEIVYLTGGSSLVQGLKEKITEDTGVAVDVINPFHIVSEDEDKIGIYNEFREFMAVPLYLSTRVTDLT
ncbi:MAG TPA: type IV pilus assembly protein PilM [Syntrophorhabdaceae bacterium]|nr:type IV pilus assembly protein PilM [Syntrophorhabdaceae bacterium]HQM80377.1 type IV pilus assembly protein PilM [Syntrophorhabdaceae bacterium]